MFPALRSPFFAVSDDDVFQFVSSGGILNLNAPQGEGVQSATSSSPIFETLTRLHRLRRIEPPSIIIAALFARTRALPAFLASRPAPQAVANLWKVLERRARTRPPAPRPCARSCASCRTRKRAARPKGDSPVGEQAGAQVEVLTVHKAKGLEYPIVIVADLLTDPAPCRRVHHRPCRG